MRRLLLIALPVASIAAFVIIYPTGLGHRFLVPLFYRGGRPTRAGRSLNRAWSWLVSQGLTPARWPGTPAIGPATLETVGRRSSARRSNMVTWVEYEGQRYFVSMLGDRTEWVRNVRAAGGRAVLRRGSRAPVVLEEIPVSERAPIIRAWYQRTWASTRPHLRLDPHAGIEEFEPIASTHPVFRIVTKG
ncbi:MAG TPA: nitroreductase/quinone reductase family protein [Dehalococcoidia bacterium]|jgi:deazaflavin-dependent oxidoreductase (nitroreductase family)|nr:nitroreductase/quinone reductase family protein [Dehalococcoidia bacterium]